MSSDPASFEESVLLGVARGLKAASLDAIVIGNAAAALHGVPITTQDIDLFVRDTPRNTGKIDQFVAFLGDHVVAGRPFEPTSKMIRIEGLPVDVDLIFDLSSRAKFESVRTRSVVIDFADVSLRVASIDDIIEAKRAADRPKDRLALPILEQFQKIQRAMRDDEE